MSIEQNAVRLAALRPQVPYSDWEEDKPPYVGDAPEPVKHDPRPFRVAPEDRAPFMQDYGRLKSIADEPGKRVEALKSISDHQRDNEVLNRLKSLTVSVWALVMAIGLAGGYLNNKIDKLTAQVYTLPRSFTIAAPVKTTVPGWLNPPGGTMPNISKVRVKK